MNAHILTIGDEILIGQVLNTNGAFIGKELSDNNINVTKTSVVGDNENDILQEFKSALSNNDLVISTGGLGPTHDDITRKCIVDFFETELIQNDEVLEDIRSMFKKRVRKMTKVNEGQALVPKIAEVIRNSMGTAPGFWIERENKIFVAMPGVPFEMIEMMHSYVIPKLTERMAKAETIVLRKTLLTTGIPESTLFEKLGDLNEILGDAKLAFLPSQFGVKLRITVEAGSQDEASNKISEVEQKIRSKAGRFIFGKEEELLEEVIGRILKERGLTLAVAESCTGGLISNMLTNISGSSTYFERGVVSYSNAAKVEILKVNEDTIVQNGAVSIEVARQMAEGVKSISGTDLGLSATGIMGPTGATADKPVGLVYIGICDEKVCTAKEFRFGDDRLLNKERTAQAALDMLRRHLLGIGDD
ncbi:MAG TPA: competence/damage-inducible protein A [Ignavibacteriaceae bacterium]|nr:competence/damage-inducible protein A [Ignavibacteriaceae bacterium]